MPGKSTVFPSWLKRGGVLALCAGAALAETLWRAGEGGPGPLLMGTGLLTSILLISDREQRAGYLLPGLVGLTLGHLLLPAHPLLAIGLALAETLAAGLTTWAVVWLLGDDLMMDGTTQLVEMILLGLCLPVLPASLLAGLGLHLANGIPFLTATTAWFVADALGTAILAPLVLTTQRTRLRLARGGAEGWRVALHGLLLLAASLAAFGLNSIPIAFLIFPPLLLITAELGFLGGAFGCSIVAAIAVPSTLRGHGSLALLTQFTSQQRVLVLQLFLATCLLCVTVVALVLSEQRRLQILVGENEARFRLLAENSGDIIILSTLDGTRIYVSPAVEAILGWTPAEMLTQSYQELAHPEDVPAMAEQIKMLAAGTPIKGTTYRMQRKDGGYAWLEANLRPYRHARTGEVIGYVNVARDITQRRAAEQDLQNAYASLEAVATVDALTGVANRRRFDEVLTQEWRRAIRNSTSISIVLVDVDRFKDYNDLYGHLRGDSCLKQIAEAALDVIGRPGDLVARYGGEEFALVMPGATAEGAVQIAEQLRAAVEGRGLKHEGNIAGVVTISAGCATLVPLRGSSAHELINAADMALYQAKNSGRNRICCWGEDLQSSPEPTGDFEG